MRGSNPYIGADPNPIPIATFQSRQTVQTHVVEVALSFQPGVESWGYLLYWHEESKTLRRGSRDIKFFDSMRMNCGLEGEWLTVVDWHGHKRFECAGSYGLVRKAVIVNSNIAPDAAGEANIYLSGGATGFIVPVIHNWMTNGETLAVGQEVMIQWFRDEGDDAEDDGYPLNKLGAWVVIDSDCDFA